MQNENKVGRKPKPRLKIAIDCGSLSDRNTASQAGVYTVTLNLVEKLSRIDKRNRYILFSFQRLPAYLLSKKNGNISNIVLPKIGFKTIWLPLAIKFFKPNIFLATSQAVPKNAPYTLGFIYDVAFLKFPQMYAHSDALKKNTSELALNARHIITISKFTALDIQRELKVDEKRISVVYPGVSTIFKPVGSKYIDSCPYFLYVGALKKTKNLLNLIRGFAEFSKKINSAYHLILVGSKEKLDPGISKLISSNGLAEKVILKGFVETDTLPKYYRGAYAFVSIAYEEGFGLPIVEAMACGVPVIVANNSSMPEIVGKAGVLVNEQSPHSIASGMFFLTTSQVIRNKYVSLGLKQAKRYSWTKFTRGILDLVDKYLY